MNRKVRSLDHVRARVSATINKVGVLFSFFYSTARPQSHLSAT